jgi:hypothetical protein
VTITWDERLKPVRRTLSGFDSLVMHSETQRVRRQLLVTPAAGNRKRTICTALKSYLGRFGKRSLNASGSLSFYGPTYIVISLFIWTGYTGRLRSYFNSRDTITEVSCSKDSRPQVPLIYFNTVFVAIPETRTQNYNRSEAIVAGFPAFRDLVKHHFLSSVIKLQSTIFSDKYASHSTDLA